MERFADRITRGFDNAVNGRDRIDREFVQIGGRFFLINFSDQIGRKELANLLEGGDTNGLGFFLNRESLWKLKYSWNFFP